MNFLITFILLSVVNVVFSTIRSITTIKSGKIIASLISGGYFAFYNVMLIYTVADFPMWEKCLITFCCNVLGVYIVKLIEEKMRKDKIWEIRCTIPFYKEDELENGLKFFNLPYTLIHTENNEHSIFNIYSYSQEDSVLIKKVLNMFGKDIKYFVTESKTL